jgi:hypothetical protein
VLGKAITSEDDALTELSALGPQLAELRTLREYSAVVTAELDGEKDAAKAAVKIRELKAAVKTATDAANEQKKVSIKTQVDATMKQYEKGLTVPLKEMLSGNLQAELEAGTELEKTKTIATLKSLKPLGIFEQSAAGDAGGAGKDDDAKIAARAEELLEKDASLKSLASRDWSEAYKRATAQAARELKTSTT